ncbi:F-box associated domain type 1 [Arabidopsis thaliana x Arabidopsis arenosa]|nr:F-box associated ubiquitination effector family protein [Arabidopsis thaliana]AAD24648.1 hypothetical protein [Arabidopsis thaliana]AEC05956.1 F-box associated ubiquitination effector family protein [Arabidopsis thaliana]KAG7635938.1 F-box associated domain type 1 [Arabidopsis thaliana x Arabidopsis arenosa]|eukprot:NP_178628.1 F-box associated ubiquitination effector family protein [Arabidopsis thaliana]
MALELETTSASVETKECLEFQEFKGFLDISESCDGLVCIYVHNTPSSENSKISYRLSGDRTIFANGSLHWLTGDEEGDPTRETKLVVFDIHTEMFQVIQTPPFITRNVSADKIGLCNLDGRLCISELKKDCKQEFWWRVEDNNNTWEKIFSVDLHSTSTWFGGITSRPLTPLTISKDTNKVILSLTSQERLVAFDLDPDSMVYHLYFSGYYGLAVPYLPSFFISIQTLTEISSYFQDVA